MNLSLRGSGKTRCESEEIDVLQVINQLLEHENAQVSIHMS